MKALFITPDVHECKAIAATWNSLDNNESKSVFFSIANGEPDQKMLLAAQKIKPDVIFYIGGNAGKGLPKLSTFSDLRGIAKTIHLCWDATDEPFHQTLRDYRDNYCFDLQVSLDGAKNVPGIDYSTLTPVDIRYYEDLQEKHIKCGFMGQVGRNVPRSNIIGVLRDRQILTTNERNKNSPYSQYASFLLQCRMMINTSWCGSGLAHHTKIRILEGSFARCAILEMRKAPTTEWIPEELLFLYDGVEEAQEIITQTPLQSVKEKAKEIHSYVHIHYTPKIIFGKILEKAGL